MSRLLRRVILRMSDIRLRNKLMLSYIFVVFIPVLLVGIILTAEFREHALKQATGQTLNNVDRIKKRTSDILRMPLDISNKLLTDKRLNRIVNTNYESTFDVVKAYWDYNDSRDYNYNYKEVYNVRFYTTNPTLLTNWEILQAGEETKQAFWYKEASDPANDSILWYYVQDETKGSRSYFSLIRKINFPEYRTNGILVIDVDRDELNAIVSQEPFDTMILDGKGIIIAAKNRDWVGHAIADLDLGRDLLDKPKGTYEINYGGQPSKMVIEDLLPPSSRNGLKIVSVFTIASIVSEADRISKLGLSIMLISLVIAVVLIYFTSSFLTRRLLLLYKVLSRVALGDLNAVSTVQGNDEIGLLSRQFNHMVASIRGLMEEVTETQRQKSNLELRQKDIKLKMMASQINPHFLFNALESIRMKAHVNGQTEISNIVKLLGKLMRRSIEVGGRKVKLKEELELVRYYLEIQKFRYGDERLSFRVEAEEDALLEEVPPLIIQPLVENAVLHGLETMEFGGFVSVTAHVGDGSLWIKVADNGVGIASDRMAEIRESLEDPDDAEGQRIGLRNVHQRLLLSCGQGLILESEPGQGTRILMRMPAGPAGAVQLAEGIG